MVAFFHWAMTPKGADYISSVFLAAILIVFAIGKFKRRER
jgi:hypothetical protein